MHSLKFIYVFSKGKIFCHILLQKQKCTWFPKIAIKFIFVFISLTAVSHILCVTFPYLIQYKLPMPKASNCHAFIYNQQLISSRDRILAAAIQRGSFENRSWFDLKPS